MNKIFKIIGVTLAAAILLALTAIILLLTLVNPNQLKPLIIEQVKARTGRDLILDGSITWKFFPYLGIKIGHMALGNPDGFPQKTFAEIDNGTAGIALLPLLHGTLQSDGIFLKGMKLHLIKNAAGQINWQFHPTAASTTANSGETASSARNSRRFNFAISAIDIKNSDVSYLDEQTRQRFEIKKFTLQAKDINSLQPFPITTSFDFNAAHLAASGHVLLTANMSTNQEKQIYTLRGLKLNADILQSAKKVHLQLSGNLTADLLQQTLQWTDFSGTAENLTITGKINVSQLTANPSIDGQFEILPFDLKKFLQKTGQDIAALQNAGQVTGSIKLLNDSKGFSAKGSLHVENITAAKLKMDHLKLQAELQNNILNLSAINANLYEGTLESQGKIDFQPSQPTVSLRLDLKNIQSQPLLKDLTEKDQKLTVAGIANISLQAASMIGKTPDIFLSHLNGSSQFSFNNGSLLGVDLGYLIDSAYAVVKKKALPAPSENKTNFGNLTGTAKIQNGVISNQDLVIDSPRFLTNGQGTINLIDQTINYKLAIAVNKQAAEQKNDLRDLFGVTIPVTISGNLNDPRIRLDTTALLKAAAQQQIKKFSTDVQEQLGNKAQEQAGKLLQNLLGQ